jgi:hypothetical protein
MINICHSGNNPTMRYLNRTHEVGVAWLMEVFNLPKCDIYKIDAKLQAADIGTKRITCIDTWRANCVLINLCETGVGPASQRTLLSMLRNDTVEKLTMRKEFQKIKALGRIAVNSGLSANLPGGGGAKPKFVKKKRVETNQVIRDDPSTHDCMCCEEWDTDCEPEYPCKAVINHCATCANPWDTTCEADSVDDDDNDAKVDDPMNYQSCEPADRQKYVLGCKCKDTTCDDKLVGGIVPKVVVAPTTVPIAPSQHEPVSGTTEAVGTSTRQIVPRVSVAHMIQRYRQDVIERNKRQTTPRKNKDSFTIATSLKKISGIIDLTLGVSRQQPGTTDEDDEYRYESRGYPASSWRETTDDDGDKTPPFWSHKTAQTKGELRKVSAQGHFDRVIIEWCCEHDSMMGKSSKHSSGCKVIRLTIDDDLRTSEGLRKAIQIVQNCPRGRTLLWSSMPCAGGSPWQTLNVAMGKCWKISKATGRTLDSFGLTSKSWRCRHGLGWEGRHRVA